MLNDNSSASHQVMSAAADDGTKPNLPPYLSQPSDTSSTGISYQTHEQQRDAVYSENQFGELLESPPSDAQPQSSGPSSGIGHNTTTQSEQYRADKLYPENRFGELGRADTFTDESSTRPHLSDKIKGTTEQVVGKILGNEELYEKGSRRKSLSPLGLENSTA